MIGLGLFLFVGALIGYTFTLGVSQALGLVFNRGNCPAGVVFMLNAGLSTFRTWGYFSVVILLWGIANLILDHKALLDSL